MSAQKIFGLHCRQSDSKAQTALEHSREVLEANGFGTFSLQQMNTDLKAAEAVLVFGGDGTVLHTARLMAPLQIPVLGVNFGHVGYLCAIDNSELDQALQKLIEGQYTVERRNMLHGSVLEDGRRLWKAEALNDFLVGGSNRTVTLEVSIDGSKLGIIRGDGVILATKTGSTAYAFSAGGPIMLTENALCLVASNPVFSSIRSLVLPDHSVIRIRSLSEYVSPFVVADGQNDWVLSGNMELELQKAKNQALFIQFDNHSPVENLYRSFQKLILKELDYSYPHP
ncbi:NAD(+)/NADH kinase [bacterium]|nr:NAD(+)/NADH kinase [bacterium]